MKPTYDELVQEVARLRAKLSPLEDKEFTKRVVAALAKPNVRHDLANFGAMIRGRLCISGKPGDLWVTLFGTPSNVRDIAKLGRSLQALGWERGAKRGDTIFTIPVEELENEV